jgi:hypothetical protein
MAKPVKTIATAMILVANIDIFFTGHPPHFELTLARGVF